VNKPKEA